MVDMQGITLPGCTLQIEVKAPVDADRCLYLFSIMRMVHTKRMRNYQLEVAPHSKLTHNILAKIYGPHEHYRSEEPTAVASMGVTCDNWTGSLAWFFNRVNVTPFDIENPNRHVEL